MQSRSGIITLQGRPLTLVGTEAREGDRLPDFVLLANDLTPVRANELRGRALLINVVPSLDTAVCSAQTRRFNEELDALPEPIEVITVSADLPFAQARFATLEKIRHRILSDHLDLSFGDALGLHILELRLLARAVLIVDREGKIAYREIVPEIGEHPDYEAALVAAHEAG
jgi:thiol peroxidase